MVTNTGCSAELQAYLAGQAQLLMRLAVVLDDNDDELANDDDLDDDYLSDSDALLMTVGPLAMVSPILNNLHHDQQNGVCIICGC